MFVRTQLRLSALADNFISNLFELHSRCELKNEVMLAIYKFCSIITSNLNWRKSVCSLSLFDADEDSLYLALGTGLNCYVPNRVIKKSLPFILLLMAYSC